MGNLNNPSINRWGLNLFWYKMWYNDKIRQLYIQQDVIFEKLIYFYLYYGFNYTFNIFKHMFWYPVFLFEKYEQLNHNLKYIRQYEFLDKFTNENVTVVLRNRTKDFFASKIWLLRYQNWILINFYTFQPIKKKKKFVKTFNKNYTASSVEFTNRNRIMWKRLKTFFSLLTFYKTTPNYKF